MNAFSLLAFYVACVLAVPYVSRNDAFGSSKLFSTDGFYSTSKQPIVPILKQIHQVDDEDGSYTFGYEASDGTFRVEKKDSDGYIIGKYGFYDVNNKFQVVDYVAGKSLGFQPSGELILAIPMKVNPDPSYTLKQKALDFEYSSVDDDEDGVPDHASGYQSTLSYQQQREVHPVVRQEIGGYQHKTVQPVVRVDSPTYQRVDQQQPLVRLETTEYQQKVAQPLDRLDSPGYLNLQPVVRLETEYQQRTAVQPEVRLESPTYQKTIQPAFGRVEKTGYGNQDQTIQFEHPASLTVAAPSFSRDNVQQKPDSNSINSPDFFGL